MKQTLGQIMNGNKWLILTVTVIYLGLFAVIGHTWTGVSENRRDIAKVKDCIGMDMSEILQRLARIEAKLEN